MSKILQILVVNLPLVSVLLNVRDVELPHHCFYEPIEIDEFWIFVGRKSKRVWLIYAFDRVSKKIISYVWGNGILKR